MEGNFVYSKKDVLVAGVAVVIIVTLLGVGFGVTSGASIQTVVESSEFESFKLTKFLEKQE